MTVLDEIIANKRIEVKARKEVVSVGHLSNMCAGLPAGRSFKEALKNSDTGIISEFKRKSPSKGMIHPGADVMSVTGSYEKAGCTGISVLTDYKYFGGTLSDLKNARATVSCPILRKDFIVDSYQVYVSKILGADMILLIAAGLTKEEVYDFGELAHELGMEVLLEVHQEEELEYINRFTDIVGVNNRNLKLFKTDVKASFDLADKIPSGYVKISESGIIDAGTVKDLRSAGYNGFLIGENFMKEENAGNALENFIKEIKSK